MHIGIFNISTQWEFIEQFSPQRDHGIDLYLLDNLCCCRCLPVWDSIVPCSSGWLGTHYVVQYVLLRTFQRPNAVYITRQWAGQSWRNRQQHQYRSRGGREERTSQRLTLGFWNGAHLCKVPIMWLGKQWAPMGCLISGLRNGHSSSFSSAVSAQWWRLAKQPCLLL